MYIYISLYIHILIYMYESQIDITLYQFWRLKNRRPLRTSIFSHPPFLGTARQGLIRHLLRKDLFRESFVPKMYSLRIIKKPMLPRTPGFPGQNFHCFLAKFSKKNSESGYNLWHQQKQSGEFRTDPWRTHPTLIFLNPWKSKTAKMTVRWIC